MTSSTSKVSSRISLKAAEAEREARLREGAKLRTARRTIGWLVKHLKAKVDGRADITSVSASSPIYTVTVKTHKVTVVAFSGLVHAYVGAATSPLIIPVSKRGRECAEKLWSAIKKSVDLAITPETLKERLEKKSRTAKPKVAKPKVAKPKVAETAAPAAKPKAKRITAAERAALARAEETERLRVEANRVAETVLRDLRLESKVRVAVAEERVSLDLPAMDATQLRNVLVALHILRLHGDRAYLEWMRSFRGALHRGPSDAEESARTRRDPRDE